MPRKRNERINEEKIVRMRGSPIYVEGKHPVYNVMRECLRWNNSMHFVSFLSYFVKFNRNMLRQIRDSSHETDVLFNVDVAAIFLAQ